MATGPQMAFTLRADAVVTSANESKRTAHVVMSALFTDDETRAVVESCHGWGRTLDLRWFRRRGPSQHPVGYEPLGSGTYGFSAARGSRAARLRPSWRGLSWEARP